MKKLISISISIIFIVTYIFYKSSFFTKEKNIWDIPYSYSRKHFQPQDNNIRQKTQRLKDYNLYCLQKQKNCIFIPHQNIIADSIWIKSVQHAGQIKHNHNILSQQIQNINNINPQRVYPYIFTQRILPIPKESTNYNEKEKEKTRKDTINIGENGITYTCLPGAEKIVQNISETELKTKNANFSPQNSLCQNFRLPQYLAFNYFYYNDNPEQSSNYYKITALSYGSPKNSLNMPAIVIGKGGQHFKSASIRLEKGENAINDTSMTTENVQYFFNKALYEWTLDVITESNKDQTQCFQDIQCLQQNGFITRTLQKRRKECKNYDIKNRNQHTKCQIGYYGMEHNLIHSDGKLDYPIAKEKFQYARRSDRNDRGIILKE